MEHLADEIGVHITEIHIRNMKNKWASCSTTGRLTFDRSLLDQPRETQLEAILHELLHVRYPNHGRMFKRLLRAYLQQEGPDRQGSGSGGKSKPREGVGSGEDRNRKGVAAVAT